MSPSTVSRALNNHPAINIETRNKIKDFSIKVGYQQNNFAKNLRRRKSQTIGVMVHELNSHFIISVLNGIEAVTTESSYNLIIAHSDEKSYREKANAMNLFNTRVDGIVASLASDTNELSHYDPFFKKGVPIVFF